MVRSIECESEKMTWEGGEKSKDPNSHLDERYSDMMEVVS